ncbi:uncharacterized protein LOC144148474 [Haemaphysalis longicornis]
MISLVLVVALASAASAGFVPTYGVPVAGVPYAHHVVPAVASTVHHAPTVSKATHVTRYQSVHPGVPHTVAKVSTYTPAATAVHTAVHGAVPTAVVGAPVHHVPGYTYLPRYSHRVDAHPLTYRYAYGLSPYGLHYGYGPYGYTTLVKHCQKLTSTASKEGDHDGGHVK